MGRKKRSAPSTNGNDPAAKKPTPENESYTVKKYRMTSSTPLKAIDAFQKYTKTHRMSDATFTRVQPPGRGATIASPIVFSIRMGGSDLSWGRGKTRDVAIDNACRAAFGLVAAHGYNQFDMNEDCLMVEPMEILNHASVVPPPPPPPTGGMIPGLPPPPSSSVVPLPPGGVAPPLPPMATGGAPPLPPGGPPPPVMMDLIPQPKVQDGTLAQSSNVTRVGGTDGGSLTGGGTVSLKPAVGVAPAQGGNGSSVTRTKLKGGLTLVYQAETEDGGIMSMEERRAQSVRYKGVLEKALALRTIALA